MSMTCKQVQASFDERLDGRVNATNQQAFDAHVASCPTCGREWKAYAALWQTLARHEGVEPSFGFTERTLRRLDEALPAAQPAFWRLALPRWAVAASLVAVLCASGLLAWQHQRAVRRAEIYAAAQQDSIEDFDVIASLDKLNGGNQL